ncbi:hypothetical protein [Roseibium album]|uniref:hypothetical protein n=1 Tax=Roseibium album TaxID=311410 RepID=UPI0024928EEE|nr:hypothetical protein [Roseibium album]
MKEWLTAGEIAKLKLPGMPDYALGVRRFMEKQNTQDDPRLCRKREGKGGGYWYHYTAMSPDAIVEYDALENGLEVNGQSMVIFSAKKHRERAFIYAMHYRYPGLDGGDLWKLYDKAFGALGSDVVIPRQSDFVKYCSILFYGETTLEQKLYSLIANEISQKSTTYLSHLVIDRTKAQYELIAELAKVDLKDGDGALNALAVLKSIAGRQWQDVPDNIKSVFEGKPASSLEAEGISDELHRLTITKLTNELNIERERMRALQQEITKQTKGWKTNDPNALQRRLKAIADAAYASRW